VTTCVHMYTEHRVNGEWVATSKDTFNEEKPNRFGWVNATMRKVDCPENYQIYGLLHDGVRTSWPWAFKPRGVPMDVSEEVRSVCDSFGFEGYGHSHITLKHLVEKYLELLVAGPDAKILLPYLRELIESVPRAVENHHDVRVVFWFDS
jgi:hypothetical protein